MDAIEELKAVPKEWQRFAKRCERPSKAGEWTRLRTMLTRTEYMQICRAVAMGFAIMGVIGYLVKLCVRRKASTPTRAAFTSRSTAFWSAARDLDVVLVIVRYKLVKLIEQHQRARQRQRARFVGQTNDVTVKQG